MLGVPGGVLCLVCLVVCCAWCAWWCAVLGVPGVVACFYSCLISAPLFLMLRNRKLPLTEAKWSARSVKRCT